MKGSYKISEGAGAPEAKIRKSAPTATAQGSGCRIKNIVAPCLADGPAAREMPPQDRCNTSACLVD